MIKKIIVTLLTLQAVIFADFTGIDAAQLEQMEAKNVPVIDIRTPGEWKETGIIPGSHKIMFFDERGNYDINKFMQALQKVVPNKEQPFVLVCRSASRTKMVGDFLTHKAGYQNVKELSGGIMYGWLNKGKKLTK